MTGPRQLAGDWRPLAPGAWRDTPGPRMRITRRRVRGTRTSASHPIQAGSVLAVASVLRPRLAMTRFAPTRLFAVPTMPARGVNRPRFARLLASMGLVADALAGPEPITVPQVGGNRALCDADGHERVLLRPRSMADRDLLPVLVLMRRRLRARWGNRPADRCGEGEADRGRARCEPDADAPPRDEASHQLSNLLNGPSVGTNRLTPVARGRAECTNRLSRALLRFAHKRLRGRAPPNSGARPLAVSLSRPWLRLGEARVTAWYDQLRNRLDTGR